MIKGVGLVECQDSHLHQDDEDRRRQEQDIHLDGHSHAEDEEGKAPSAIQEQPYGHVGDERGYAVVEQAQHEDAVQALGHAEEGQYNRGNSLATDVQAHDNRLQWSRHQTGIRLGLDDSWRHHQLQLRWQTMLLVSEDLQSQWIT